jgi:predicted 2-oxoglutarate/Fe(II)-dependent dioxygenase YbiX
LGAHRHRVAPLLRGQRQSLILWARGLHTQEERMGVGVTECPEWCDE